MQKGVEQHSECNGRSVSLLKRMGTLAAADLEAYGNTEASGRYHTQSSEYDTANEELPYGREHGEEFDSLCEDLASFLFWSLEQEYDYHNSDEQVDESNIDCDYEFNEDGTRA